MSLFPENIGIRDCIIKLFLVMTILLEAKLEIKCKMLIKIDPTLETKKIPKFQ